MSVFRVLAAAGLALTALGAAGPVQAQMNLRMSLPYPATDMMVAHMRDFAQKVEERSGGDIRFDIFTDFTLFKQGQDLPALQRGNLDATLLSTVDVEQQLPEYSILSSGYLFRDYAHVQAVFDGEVGREFAERLFKDMDVKTLGILYGGTRHVNLAKARKVSTPADLAGVKLRMPGAPAWLLLGQGLGATPTPMALGELYLGLSTGTIDGQENPLTLIRALKLEEVTEQVVLTSHMVQVGVFALAASTWNRLTPEQQEIVETAASETVAAQNAARLAGEDDDLDYLRAQGLTITTPDVAAFRASVQAVFEQSGMAAGWPAGLADRIAAVQ